MYYKKILFSLLGIFITTQFQVVLADGCCTYSHKLWGKACATTKNMAVCSHVFNSRSFDDKKVCVIPSKADCRTSYPKPSAKKTEPLHKETEPLEKEVEPLKKENYKENLSMTISEKSPKKRFLEKHNFQ